MRRLGAHPIAALQQVDPAPTGNCNGESRQNAIREQVQVDGREFMTQRNPVMLEALFRLGLAEHNEMPGRLFFVVFIQHAGQCECIGRFHALQHKFRVGAVVEHDRVFGYEQAQRSGNTRKPMVLGDDSGHTDVSRLKPL